MDIEKLNKTQIILLTLLTSFVTSIATGIVTVTLMDQAPPGVTHTISKVVEKTVEKIVPAKTQGSTIIKTVVVEQKDALAEAVAKNEQSLVRIKKASNEESEEDLFISIGFVVSESGLVITDSAHVGNDIEYSVEFSDGSKGLMKVVDQSEGSGIALLLAEGEDEKNSFTPVKFADEDTLSLGEGIVALGGKENNNIQTGVITNLKMSEREVVNKNEEGEEESSVEKYLYAIYTNILGKVDSGSMLFDMKGDVAGMNIVREGNVFTVPASTVLKFIADYESSVVVDTENE